MPLNVLIGADILPNRNNRELFQKSDIDVLLGERLATRLKEADYILLNLEGPLCNGTIPISKNGPNLFAPIDTITGIKAINPFFFTLANNHILDYGEDGLASTIKILDDAGIAHAGAGKDLEEALMPHVFEIDQVKIGVYCCAEHEFSIASDSKAGANPFNPCDSFDHVATLKEYCNHVIVLYHGGKEYYRYPSPELQRRCRKFIDKGASLVVCQHTHCIGCEEKWKSGTIVYGQGNFLFGTTRNEYTSSSILINLSIGKTFLDVSYVPLEKTDAGVRESDTLDVLDSFSMRSEAIKEDGFIDDEYLKFASQHVAGYLMTFLAKGQCAFFTRLLNKLSGQKYGRWLVSHKYNKSQLLALENIIECEAHRELLMKGITCLKD